MSYMDYFQNSCRTNTKEDIKVIEGTCSSMCPEAEVILRKKEKLVHVLEVVGDKHKLVKRYARPAADTNLAVAHNLRPFYILKKTVDYLLFEVTKRTDVPILVIYNFVTDRLRAVRQDMIIQELKPNLRIILLEPMIRFHTYFGYLLCEESLNDYSPTLNRNFLLECLKTCLYSYDELDMKITADPLDINILMDNMLICSLENKQQRLDRSLVEAIYVLTNLYDESPMWRLCRLKKSLRNAPAVRLAYRVAIASLHGNYVKVCKLIDKLCPLMFCAVALFLPRIQRAALRVVCAAYGGRAGVPGGALRGWLRLPAARVSRTLQHYGVAGDAGHVRCQRAAFREDAPLLPPSKIEDDHLEQKMNIDYILTYTHLDK
ncbi:germinal-center associated nuclear protein [Epargyreus clarus]|uniref:germinal-center associated nuclear protein n=1 Tax=Epargyreus clarus TaxID=520877 RepID=UPI003C2EE53B